MSDPLPSQIAHYEDRMVERCPTCNSPEPARHPAMQFEGEVQICRDEYHLRQCDCCGKMKSDVVSVYVRYAGDTSVCGECRDNRN